MEQGLRGSPFIPAQGFAGAKAGYEFKTAEFGLGYYRHQGSEVAPAAAPLESTAITSSGYLEEQVSSDDVIEGRKVETRAPFVFEACDFCRDGYVPLTLDGGVLKKVLQKSEELRPRVPVEGCPTTVQFIGRLLDEYGSIFETTRDVVDGKHVGGTDDPHEFHLLRDKWIKGLDIGISTMAVGETARFIIRPQYAYGADGYPPKVMPHDSIDFEVELLSFGDPIPRFPSKAELEISRKEREEEERKQYEENPPPGTDEKIRMSLIEKEKGNDLYKKGDYEKAQKQYDTAFVYVFTTKEEWEGFLSAEEKDAIRLHKMPLHLNRGMCKLKLGKLDDALWDTDQALEIDPGNLKGHMRRIKVYAEKLQEECLDKEKAGQFWQIKTAESYIAEARISLDRAKALAEAKEAELKDEASAKNTKSTFKADMKQIARLAHELKQKQHKVAKCREDYKAGEKELYKDKIIGGLDARNQRLAERERHVHDRQEAREAQDYEDMPSLDDDGEEEEGG